MNINKFNNDFIDNLIKFENIKDNPKFKESDYLNYLIENRRLLLIIPFLFKNIILNSKKTELKKEYQKHIDNKFKNYILNNNINKLIVKGGDKPDLIIIQNNEQIGLELTSAFPFKKLEPRGGNSIKCNNSKILKILKSLRKILNSDALKELNIK